VKDRLRRLMCEALRRNLERAADIQIPAGGELLWRWFLDLCGTRAVTMAGAQPISFAEIEAYARLTGWQIEARHVAVLRAMDAEFLAFGRRQAQAQPIGTAKMSPPVSSRPLTAGLLDGILGR
jgi:hypothetical protein